MDAFLMNGVPVGAPDRVSKLVALEEVLRRRRVEPACLSSLQERGLVGCRLAMLEVQVGERAHVPLLLAKLPGPKHQPLGINWLPVGLHTIVQLNACPASQLAHALLRVPACALAATAVAQQTLVPGPLLALRHAVTLERGAVSSTWNTSIPQERVRVACDIQQHRDVGVLLVEWFSASSMFRLPMYPWGHWVQVTKSASIRSCRLEVSASSPEPGSKFRGATSRATPAAA
eukprot:CAMPEP_0179032008 /NCGR_PEP_ID=MMETSP0796-20121207/11361_1 /TAXON_ID=73915 /ORGANISM="Pyrodinium bahamense, Strain pbaha01" /LENGTH=230 /DNA_ID=CAMNT_0020728211 /DNA_START=211 /DNA_END=901 /DNA_ORIENTATION=+